MVRQSLEQVISDACPADVGWTLEFTAVQRAFIGSDSGELVDALSAAHLAVLGTATEVGTRLPGEAFVTDAADMAAFGIETVVYGPCDWQYAPDESVEIEELVAAARVYLETALRLR